MMMMMMIMTMMMIMMHNTLDLPYSPLSCAAKPPLKLERHLIIDKRGKRKKGNESMILKEIL